MFDRRLSLLKIESKCRTELRNLLMLNFGRHRSFQLGFQGRASTAEDASESGFDGYLECLILSQDVLFRSPFGSDRDNI